MSADKQRVTPAVVCAGGCAVLALPVLLPVLLAFSPLLLIAGLIWLIWRKLSIASNQKAVALSSSKYPPKVPEQVCIAVTICTLHQQAQLSHLHHAPRLCSCCQVDAAPRQPVPTRSSAPSSDPTTARSTPLAQSPSSAKPAATTSSTDPRITSLNASAKADTKDNSDATSAVPAKAPIQREGTQQAAAPATGSAALLARIRSALCHLLKSKQPASQGCNAPDQCSKA